MKGPYERVKYDLRRLWECPVCQRRERAPGSATSRLCLCQMQKADGQPVVMKLVEDGVQRTVPPVLLVHEPLPPLPPLVLPPDEPRERAAGQGASEQDRVNEALNPSHSSTSGVDEGMEPVVPAETSLSPPPPLPPGASGE